VHKMISIISNLPIIESSEIFYLCKTLLIINKSDHIDYYMESVKKIIEFDKTIIGL